MFTALSESGELVEADVAVRGLEYRCPDCEMLVVLKRGHIVISHFAHEPNAQCYFGQGEGYRHLQMKKQVRDVFGKVELEVRLGDQVRADVIVRGRIIVECQASSISIPDMEYRTRTFNAFGYSVLWLFDSNRIANDFKDTVWWRIFSDESVGEREYRIPAEIKEWHRQSFGRVYLLDEGGEIVACHFRPPYSRWNDYVGYSFFPKTLRRVTLEDRGKRWRQFKSPEGLELCGFNEPIWWDVAGERMVWKGI